MTAGNDSWFPDLDQQLWIGPVLAILLLLLKSAFTYAWGAWRGEGKEDAQAQPGKASPGERSFPQPLLVRVFRK